MANKQERKLTNVFKEVKKNNETPAENTNTEITDVENTGDSVKVVNPDEKPDVLEEYNRQNRERMRQKQLEKEEEKRRRELEEANNQASTTLEQEREMEVSSRPSSKTRFSARTQYTDATPTLADAIGGIMNEYEEKQKKKTVEETHIRRTYLIDRELDKKLNALAKKRPKGFKTHIVNKAIEIVLKELEG
jgi:hypothetical protein